MGIIIKNLNMNNFSHLRVGKGLLPIDLPYTELPPLYNETLIKDFSVDEPSFMNSIYAGTNNNTWRYSETFNFPTNKVFEIQFRIQRYIAASNYANILKIRTAGDSETSLFSGGLLYSRYYRDGADVLWNNAYHSPFTNKLARLFIFPDNSAYVYYNDAYINTTQIPDFDRSLNYFLYLKVNSSRLQPRELRFIQYDT